MATFYVARTLGPQNFGELSYAQSVVGILALFSALVGALYRDLVRHKDKENIFLGTAWVIGFSAAFITTALALLYIIVIPHDQLTMWVIGILCISQFFSPFSIITNVFYAKTETKWLSLVNLVIHIAMSLLKIMAMLLGHGVLILAVIMVVEQIIMAVSYLTLYVLSHKGSPWSWKFDLSYAKTLVADSFPIMIIAASGIVSARVDQIFLKHLIDTTTVGLYNVAVQLSEIWHLIPGMLMMALFPSIINSRKVNMHTYRARLASLGGLFLLYSLALAILISVLSHIIVPMIYGVAFLDSVSILQIYIWSMPGLVLSLLISNFLIAENMRKIQIVSAILPMLINVILNLILIPRFGALGAAWATVISYSFAPLIFLFYANARSVIFPRRL